MHSLAINKHVFIDVCLGFDVILHKLAVMKLIA